MVAKRVVNRINHIFLGLGISAIASISLTNSAAIAQPATPIPQQPVEPSLWWKSQRLDEGWVENITINSEIKKVIVTINTTRWFASDYLQRFSFLFKLGTEAQKQDYDVILDNRFDEKLAEYTTQGGTWKMDPKSLGADPFRVSAPKVFSNSSN